VALSKLTTASFTPNGISIPSISASSQFNGMKNLLINGDFRVWQKGTDLNPLVTGSAVTGVDRWTNSYCDFIARLRKVEDTINGETVDTVEITKSSGTYTSCEFTQKIETNVSKYLRGQTVTFSFWVKKVGSTFGTHSCQFWLGDSETVDDTGWTNQRTYDRGRSSGVTGTNSNIVFSNNNWTKYSITRTLSADTNTIYCTIYTASTPTGEGVRIAKCQLEVGSVATDFERRPIAFETQVCQRYCVVDLYDATNMPSFNGYWSTNTAFEAIRFFPAEMRTPPSLSMPTVGGMYVLEPQTAWRQVSSVSANEIGTKAGKWTFNCATNSSWSSTGRSNGVAGLRSSGSVILNAEF
jgi:hypothetical protein